MIAQSGCARASHGRCKGRHLAWSKSLSSAANGSPRKSQLANLRIVLSPPNRTQSGFYSNGLSIGVSKVVTAPSLCKYAPSPEPPLSERRAILKTDQVIWRKGVGAYVTSQSPMGDGGFCAMRRRAIGVAFDVANQAQITNSRNARIGSSARILSDASSIYIITPDCP